MIFKSTHPGSPEVSVILSGVSVDYTTIQSVTVDLHENMHDMATITFSGLIPVGITDYINAPVYISIAAGVGRIVEFFGYVTFIEPLMETRKGLINNSPVQSAVATCMGASDDLSLPKHRTWEKVTLPQLVEKIATSYGYSYAVPADSFVWQRLLQNGISDWELLLKACQTIGYSLTTSATHIHVYDPYKTISRQLPYAELVTVKGASGDIQYAPGRIMEFKGLFGNTTLDGTVYNYDFVGLDSAGKLVKGSTSDESFSKYGELVERVKGAEATANVVSQEMLNKVVEASTKTTYPYNATVVTTGIPDPVPGSVVKIDKYASNFDGFWLVRGIKHTISRSNYVSELEISTDSTTGKQYGSVPGSAFKTPPVPQISKAHWVSSVDFGDIYV
jgi:phage protein D